MADPVVRLRFTRNWENALWSGEVWLVMAPGPVSHDRMRIECLADYACEVGECPVWHPVEQKLYWTDIPRGRLFWYDPATDHHGCCYEGRPVGGMTVQEDGSLLLFRDRGNIVQWRDGKETSTVVESIPGLEETRFNDVIADPLGGVFAGTMSFGPGGNGRLYRIHSDGTFQLVSEGHQTPNGMGFSGDLSVFYFTDSRRRRIYRCSFHKEDSVLSEWHLFLETSEKEAASIGRSDGMTIDEADHIWSARWDGSRLLRFAPDGSLQESILMPVHRPTSLTFGGPRYETLFITSAGGAEKHQWGELAGALFACQPGVSGRPEFRSRVCL